MHASRYRLQFLALWLFVVRRLHSFDMNVNECVWMSLFENNMCLCVAIFHSSVKRKCIAFRFNEKPKKKNRYRSECVEFRKRFYSSTKWQPNIWNFLILSFISFGLAFFIITFGPSTLITANAYSKAYVCWTIQTNRVQSA